MAQNPVETLGAELEQVDREYANDFAGHSRLSRDLSQMDAMIKRTRSILERIDRIPSAAQGPDLARLRDAAAQALSLYMNERSAIARAQDVGPAFEQFANEATSANFTFSRYMRHFAGKSRSTRDASLLGELVDDLRQIEKRMTQLLDGKEITQGREDLAKDREVVRANLKQYQEEIGLVEDAQKGEGAESEASILATLANNQFATYQTHFAGEARVSRRPALLVRVTNNLRKVRDRMVALRDAGLAADFNGRNISIIDERLALYERELGEIRKLRQATPMTDIMAELGGAANKLFDEYREHFADKQRSQADATRLGNICDKLAEIRRQMVEMSWAEESEMNLKNLDIVTEQLGMFEGEYEQVVRAQTPAKT